MNKLELLNEKTKTAYLNYQNGYLKETINYLDQTVEELLKDDTSLDPFWGMLTHNIFKAIFLNNYYNKIEYTLNDLDRVLLNLDDIRKNLSEFCNHFTNNDTIDIVKGVQKITDNPLKSVVNILLTNLENVKNTNEN